MSRRRAFTLIELLVVIAIIGILAAMVFPVFARARESARKAVCLSNVKNIALAVNMYLSDNNDTFPPEEHRPEVMDYLTARGCDGDAGGDGNSAQAYADKGNPYLRWPVVLDEYIKNRDVWRCPSSKRTNGADFIIGGGGDWLDYLKRNEGLWEGTLWPAGICNGNVFPPGWGGSVTDSILQQKAAGAGSGQRGETGSAAERAFVQTLSVGEQNFYDVKLGSISSVVGAPICADGGAAPDWLSVGTVAYPDLCAAECCGFVALEPLWGWPYAGCPDGTYCPDCAEAHAGYWSVSQGGGIESWGAHGSRHLGGVNIGFADGHAAWYNSKSIGPAVDDGSLVRLGLICGPTTSAQGHEADPACGPNVGGMYFLVNKPIGWTGNN